MCGINGFTFSNIDLVKKMKEYTKRRGPDADGIYVSDEVTISHDRLSIIDLSNEANQPMINDNLILSFNGEIYNYKELKNDLEENGYKFKTNSDSEVILNLFKKYNIEAFKKLKGIFAICLWDKKSKKLYLIRDKVGVKPLYYYVDPQNNLIFSTSIKSILLSVKNKQLNHRAFNYYKNFGRNDLKETIFKNIYKLMPGELIIKTKKDFNIIKFLKFEFVEETYTDNQIKEEIDEIINYQLVSDVPIALSLSGGVDSNTAYSVMRKKYGKSINIYSFYFSDYEKFNEDFKIAKTNSEFYENNFIPVNISHNDFSNCAEKVVEILEEPTGNQCSILNYVMSKHVKEKILLTGDGGDETFTGYDKYRSIYLIQQFQKLNLFKNFKINTKLKNLNRFFFNDIKDFYLSFSEQNLFINPNFYYKDFEYITKDLIGLNHTSKIDLENRLNSISFLDLDTVVPNEYLLRNDKIFSNEGIEVRVPMLDEGIVNKFLNISEHRKFGYLFKSKSLLKKIYKNDIHSLTKKKWGLQSPFAKWMKNPLQNFLKEVLSEGYYENSKNYFNFKNIQNLIIKHKKEYHNPDFLWSLVMMQLFLRKFRL